MCTSKEKIERFKMRNRPKSILYNKRTRQVVFFFKLDLKNESH